MKMRFPLALFGALFLALPALAETAAMDDFAYGRALLLPAGSAVGECEVPLAVYQRVAGAALTDLAVFNGRGEVVPWQLHAPTAPIVEPPVPMAIPFFPLPTPTVAGEALFAVTVGGGGNAEFVTVRHEGAAPALSQHVLLDLRTLPQTVERLEFDWLGADGVFRIDIAAGDDPGATLLPLTAATIYRLHYADRRIVGERVQLPAPQRRVLRLTVHDAPAGFRLVAVRGYAPPAQAVPPLELLTLSTSQEGKNSYRFTLPGPLPLAELRILPPQANTVAQVSLESRPGNDGPWQRRGGGEVYALQVAATDLRSPPLHLHGSDRHWRLVVDESGGGFGSGLPQVEIAWQPQRLRFVARGEGPFLLAYGSGRHDLQTAPSGSFVGAAGSSLTATTVQLGPEQLLGGDEALRHRVTPQRWKTIVLWGALGGSVLLLAVMAISLQRRLGGMDSRD